jgi:hypothetical protein
MADGSEEPDDGQKPEKNRPDRGARGRFARGNKANPHGRPKGSRNRATQLIEQLMEGEAEGLARVLIKKAKAGDGTALGLVFARLAPPRRDRPIQLVLPCLDNLVAGHDAVIGAVAAGQLSPQEGRAMSEHLDQRQRAVEHMDFAGRLSALEARLASSKEHSK